MSARSLAGLWHDIMQNGDAFLDKGASSKVGRSKAWSRSMWVWRSPGSSANTHACIRSRRMITNSKSGNAPAYD
jgi:hypothetical protein